MYENTFVMKAVLVLAFLATTCYQLADCIWSLKKVQWVQLQIRKSPLLGITLSAHPFATAIHLQYHTVYAKKKKSFYTADQNNIIIL